MPICRYSCGSSFNILIWLLLRLEGLRWSNKLKAMMIPRFSFGLLSWSWGIDNVNGNFCKSVIWHGEGLKYSSVNIHSKSYVGIEKLFESNQGVLSGWFPGQRRHRKSRMLQLLGCLFYPGSPLLFLCQLTLHTHLQFFGSSKALMMLWINSIHFTENMHKCKFTQEV